MSGMSSQCKVTYVIAASLTQQSRLSLLWTQILHKVPFHLAWDPSRSCDYGK